MKTLNLPKIKILRKDFKVYGRCTICTLTVRLPKTLYTMDFMPRILWKWCEKHSDVQIVHYCSGCLMLKVQGKSLQHSKDTFDEKFGKILAESRAKKKLYKYCNTFYTKLLKINALESDLILAVLDKNSKQLESEKSYIDNLLKDNNYGIDF